ncbi:MAG: YciI family protein [Gemmatimonadota bacterium]
MNDYIFFMHDDVPDGRRRPVDEWEAYFASLRAVGAFLGGSAIGDGMCISKAGATAPVTRHLGGYIRVRAADLAAARELVVGNPVYEAGGTVEIRELPRTT